MATYSSNVTIKVNAAVFANYTGGGAGNVTMYTAPANGYAIVGLLRLSGSTSVFINGILISVSASPASFFHLGPGQSFQVASGVSNFATLQGVEFVNS